MDFIELTKREFLDYYAEYLKATDHTAKTWAYGRSSAYYDLLLKFGVNGDDLDEMQRLKKIELTK